MGLKKEFLLLFLLVPVVIWAFFFVRNNYLYPYLTVRKLSSSQYVEEIKARQGYYKNQENKVVWRSKKLNITPPKISKTMSDAKVLAADAGTWIDINLSTQTLCLHHSGQINCFAVSTGLPRTPTPTGTFHIWIKLASTSMSGPGYYLPGVPWTMYYYKGYGIHGTYWHSNFGHPMSHGCVNMYTPNAHFVFDRVSVGTKVVSHY